MAFSISGSTITQTGTDTDLMALGGVSGVTTTSSVSGATQFVHYFIGDRRLVIQGELTIDPRRELLQFGTTSPVRSLELQNGGTLNLGKDVTNQGFTYQTKGIGVIIPSTALVACCDDAAVKVRPGATFNWKGAEMRVASCINWDAGSNVNITNGRLRNTRGSLVRIRSFSTNLRLNGLDIEGGVSIDFFRTPVEFSGLVPIDGDRAIEYIGLGTGGTNDLYTNVGYNSNAVNYDFSVWNGADVKVLNPEKTVYSIAGPTNVVDSLLRQSGSLRIKATDQAGALLEGIKVYFRDFDNGNRANIQPRSGTNYNLDQTQVYDDVSTADGLLDLEILTRVNYPSTTIRRESGYNYMQMITDWRTENQDHNVLVKMFSYLYSYTSVSLDLAIGSINELDWVHLRDFSITEESKMLVDSYDEIETSRKFYDRAKAYLFDNYAGELAVLVTLTNNTIDTGNYNVVIDSQAVEVFSLSGNTITIKADVFTGNISTTGSVSLLNGSTVLGGVSDSNGDAQVQGVGLVAGQRVRVYVTFADVVADTNHVMELIADVNGETKVRYTYIPDTTYHLASFMDDGAGQQIEGAQGVKCSYQLKEGIDNEVNFSVGEGTFLPIDRQRINLLPEIRGNVNLTAERNP